GRLASKKAPRTGPWRMPGARSGSCPPRGAGHYADGTALGRALRRAKRAPRASARTGSGGILLRSRPASADARESLLPNARLPIRDEACAMARLPCLAPWCCALAGSRGWRTKGSAGLPSSGHSALALEQGLQIRERTGLGRYRRVFRGQCADAGVVDQARMLVVV